jgi:hypothetical protein
MAVFRETPTSLAKAPCVRRSFFRTRAMRRPIALREAVALDGRPRACRRRRPRLRGFPFETERRIGVIPGENSPSSEAPAGRSHAERSGGPPAPPERMLWREVGALYVGTREWSRRSPLRPLASPRATRADASGPVLGARLRPARAPSPALRNSPGVSPWAFRQ